MAESLGTRMAQGQVNLAALLEAEAQGYGARDMASILDFTRKAAR